MISLLFAAAFLALTLMAILVTIYLVLTTEDISHTIKLFAAGWCLFAAIANAYLIVQAVLEIARL